MNNEKQIPPLQTPEEIVAAVAAFEQLADDALRNRLGEQLQEAREINDGTGYVEGHLAERALELCRGESNETTKRLVDLLQKAAGIISMVPGQKELKEEIRHTLQELPEE